MVGPVAVAVALGFGAVVVGFAVVVAGFGVVVVAWGCVVVGLAVAEATCPEITGDFVDGAWLAVGVATGAVRVVVCVAGTGFSTSAGFATTVVVRLSLLSDGLADGCHAGRFVASADRSGSPTEGATTPPTTVTAPTDFGPSNNWNTPMMPVRMNIVMSHNCQRFGLTPIAILSLPRPRGPHATETDLWWR